MSVHDINGRPYKYIKFIGDYSKLKSMGYGFQKLFANNYMQWSKHSGNEYSPSTRIWKKGTDVTIDQLTNYEGSFFELYTSGENLPWSTGVFTKTPALRIVTNNRDYSVSFDYQAYIEQERRNFELYEAGKDDEASHNLSVVWLTKEHLAALDELIELGWVELENYDE